VPHDNPLTLADVDVVEPDVTVVPPDVLNVQ
jgi:hypothetical protein